MIKQGANVHMISIYEDDKKEGVLEVCARWSHTHILEYLLKEFKWSKEEIKEAMKETFKGSRSYVMIKNYASKEFGSGFAMCCLSTKK